MSLIYSRSYSLSHYVPHSIFISLSTYYSSFSAAMGDRQEEALRLYRLAVQHVEAGRWSMARGLLEESLSKYETAAASDLLLKVEAKLRHNTSSFSTDQSEGLRRRPNPSTSSTSSPNTQHNNTSGPSRSVPRSDSAEPSSSSSRRRTTPPGTRGTSSTSGSSSYNGTGTGSGSSSSSGNSGSGTGTEQPRSRQSAGGSSSSSSGNPGGSSTSGNNNQGSSGSSSNSRPSGTGSGKKKDYYTILGIPRNATEDEIKRAYRKMALKYHPDKNPSPDAEEAFKEVGAAYATLSDSHKRRIYDETGSDDPDQARGRGFGGFSQSGGRFRMNGQAELTPEDIVRMFFGGGMGMGGMHFGGESDEDGGRSGVPRRRGQSAFQRHFRRAEPGDGEGGANLMHLVHFLPLLVLVLFSVLASNSGTPSQPWALQPTSQFTTQRTTQRGTVYFVSPSFAYTYGRDPRQLSKLEQQVHAY